MRTLVVRLLTCLFATVCLSGAAIARAQDGQGTEAQPFSLFTDADFVSGSVGGTSFMKGGIGAGLRFDFTRRASAYVGMRAGFLRLRFDHSLAQGLSTDGTFWGAAEPSGRFGIAYALLAGDVFRLTMNGELEMSLPGSGLSASRMRLTTNDGTFDITSYADSDVFPALFWNRLSVGTAFSAKVGHFEPGLSVAFERVTATVDLRLSPNASASLRALGYAQQKVEREYSIAQGTWMVPIRPTLGYHFGESDALRIGGTIAPGGPLYGGNLTYLHSW